MLAFDVASNGTISNRRNFARYVSVRSPGHEDPAWDEDNGADGMAVDSEGRVYAATNSGVEVFSPGGNCSASYPSSGRRKQPNPTPAKRRLWRAGSKDALHGGRRFDSSRCGRYRRAQSAPRSRDISFRTALADQAAFAWQASPSECGLLLCPRSAAGTLSSPLDLAAWGLPNLATSIATFASRDVMLNVDRPLVHVTSHVYGICTPRPGTSP